MNVYIVSEIGWEEQMVRGVYSSYEAAVARKSELDKEAVEKGYDDYFDIQSYKVDDAI